MRLKHAILWVTAVSLLTAGCGKNTGTAYKSETAKGKEAVADHVSSTATPTPAAPTPTVAPSPTPNPTPVSTPVVAPTPVPQPKATPKESAPPKTQEDTSKGVLYGKTIFIDPGHQSKSNNQQEPIAPNSQETKEKMSYGTTGVATGVPEYKLNLQVSLRLRQLLESKGAKVVMSRETNEVNSGNVERAKMANESNAQLVVRIHADGIDNSSVKGLSVLTPGNKYISDANMLKNSRTAAEKILKSTISSTGAVSRGVVARDDLTGFNWSTVPVILIEMGFMTNADEDRLLNTAEYQDKLASGMVKGMEDYFASLSQ